MKELLEKEGNNVCADCGAKDPKWVSINIGVFLCINCAGVHRHLGTHLSQMRSIMMDVFSPQEDEFVGSKGNIEVNRAYEPFLPSQFKISESTDPVTRENFIRAKYETLLFTNPDQAKTYDPHKANPNAPKVSTATTAMVEYSGILLIQLVDAKDLIIADIISSDPYVVFQVGPQKVKSKVIDSSLNPTWNEKLQLCIPSLDEKLKISLYDKDMQNDDFLGECSVDLKPLETAKPAEFIEFHVPLQKVKKGSIHFKLAYTSITH